MTAPLTPPDCDLRDFRFMPLDVVRLSQSDMIATASAGAVVADLLLWCAAWHQVPAGSLPNDDRVLSNLAGFGRVVSAWQGVRDEVLERWVLCSDGRYYHPVVAEKAREAFKAKLAQRHRAFLAAVRKHNERNPEDKREGLSYEAWEAIGRPKEVAPAAPKLLTQAQPDLLDPLDIAPSRVTDEGVTHDKGGMSDATGAEKARDSGSKGEGQGEGQGQGDSYRIVATPASERKRGVDPFDVATLADDLARRAGVPHTQPTRIAANLDTVRQWIADGITRETVEAEIDRFRLDKPDQRVSALLFFDQGVRARVAAKAARERKGSASSPKPTMGKAVAPLACRDDDDDRVRAIRARFNGDPCLTTEYVALSIAEDAIVVTARSGFAASRVDRGKVEGIVAEVAPGFEVEVRVQ